MERRSVLRAAGATVGTATLGGVGLLATGGASASGGFEDLGSLTVESDDGTVEYIAVYGDSVVNWTGFETPANYFGIDIVLTVLDSAGTELASTGLHSTGPRELLEDWGGPNESSTGSGTSGTIESAIGLSGGTHDSTTDWHVVGTDPDGYGLPQDSVDASVLEVDGDGDESTFTLVMDSTYTWYEADDTATEIHSETFSSELDVTVNNIVSSASTSTGDGEDGVVGA